MKKEDEELIRALILRDEKAACDALDSGQISPDLMIQVSLSVNSTEGSVKDLSVQIVGTPLIVAKRLNLLNVVEKLETEEQASQLKKIASHQSIILPDLRGLIHA